MSDSTPRDSAAWKRWIDLPGLVGMAVVVYWLTRTFLGRVGYGFDLEWMEGGMLVHADRLMRGEPLYVAPSADFIPFIYPPLYPAVLAVLGAMTDLTYGLGRSVSMLGTLAAAAALVAGARAERIGWPLSILGAGLFLSCYEDSGSFYDLVRIDGLTMGLLAWALVCLRHERVRTGGLLLALAFVTKHSMAVFGLPALLWLWRYRGPRKALGLLTWSAAPALAFVFAMQVHSDGYFLTYLLEVPGGHPFIGKRFFPGTAKELWGSLPWTNVFVVVGALLGWKRGSRESLYWVLQGCMALFMSALMRGHHGGYLNVLMVGHWALALWAILAIRMLRVTFSRGWGGTLLALGTSVALCIQMGTGLWKLEKYIPTEADEEAGNRLVAALADIEGEVLSPYSPWYPVLAGKQGGFALIALWDIGHKDGPLKTQSGVVQKSLEEQRWAAILVANDKFGNGLKRYYRRARSFTPKGRALYPRTGWNVRPQYLYVPRDLTGGEEGPKKTRPEAEK